MFFKLPFYKPQIYCKDWPQIFLTHQPDKISQTLFENFKTKRVAILNSARQGIKLSLQALDLSPNSEVIVSAFICASVPEAIRQAGLKPVFCDIEKDSFNLDINSVKKRIGCQTKAIVLSHIFGLPAKIDQFQKLAQENNLVLIEDCAQAFEGYHQGKRLGSFGRFAVFSFGISKNITSFGGGALLCQKESDFKKIIRQIPQREKSLYPTQYLKTLLMPVVFNRYLYWSFEPMVEKYIQKRNSLANQALTGNISDLEAKIILTQLKQYQKIKKIRQLNWCIYQKKLSKFLSLIKLKEINQSDPLYLPVLATEDIFVKLHQKGLPVRKIQFGNLEKSPSFQKFSFDNCNEQNRQGQYFLLPLNYPLRLTSLIADQIIQNL